GELPADPDSRRRAHGVPDLRVAARKTPVGRGTIRDHVVWSGNHRVAIRIGIQKRHPTNVLLIRAPSGQGMAAKAKKGGRAHSIARGTKPRRQSGTRPSAVSPLGERPFYHQGYENLVKSIHSRCCLLLVG